MEPMIGQNVGTLTKDLFLFFLVVWGLIKQRPCLKDDRLRQTDGHQQIEGVEH